MNIDTRRGFGSLRMRAPTKITEEIKSIGNFLRDKSTIISSAEAKSAGERLIKLAEKLKKEER